MRRSGYLYRTSNTGVTIQPHKNPIFGTVFVGTFLLQLFWCPLQCLERVISTPVSNTMPTLEWLSIALQLYNYRDPEANTTLIT